MVNMKQEPRKETLCCPEGGDSPAYPYGLRVCLNEESLKKLGVSSLPSVGTTMRLEAVVEVCSASENQTAKGSERNLDLQITDMQLSTDAAQTLFGKD